jgi:hypothetical protein
VNIKYVIILHSNKLINKVVATDEQFLFFFKSKEKFGRLFPDAQG